jgi:serine phosphatase RsbU (regulator of sigma subunit)/anti-sigma regulatory factor (Ser/Thr protein kinase)
MIALVPHSSESGTRAARRSRWSIRWLVTVGMVSLVSIIVLVSGAVSERNARRALTLEMESALQLQARNLALVGAGALLTETPEWTLLPVIKETLNHQSQLVFATVVDRTGMVRADGDVRQLGTPFSPPAGLARDPMAPSAAPGEQILGNRNLVVVSAPIVQSDGRVLGTAWVGLQRRMIEQRLEAARREQLAIVAILILLGASATLLLSSALLRPIEALRVGLERIGRGDLDARLEVDDRTEIGTLADTVNRMAGALKVAQSEMVERGRLAHEMDLAQRIQRSLLPTGVQLIAPFALVGSQRAAAEVGGDYYQVFRLAGNRIGFTVADVSGKGLGGSIVTAMLHALLRALVGGFDSPAALLATLDRHLGGMLERGSFVTMFYGILDRSTNTVSFASAGHNPCLLLRTKQARAEWMRARGAPLGALRGHNMISRYEDVTLTLAPGDILLQYTDGITEAFSAAQEPFGQERMAEVALEAAPAGGQAVVDALAQAVASWRGDHAQDDDETLLVVSRDAAAVGGRGEVGPSLDVVAALLRLAEAEARGKRLTLPASLTALVRISDWLETLAPLQHLGPERRHLLTLALHEACANIVEHACGEDPSHSVDIWWVMRELDDRRAGADEEENGYFLLRDRGRRFDESLWKPSHLADPAVRRRGRGLGLDIIHRIAGTLTYWPSTPEGNLTYLAFDSEALARREESA